MLVGLPAQEGLHEDRVVEHTSATRNVRRVRAHGFIDRSVGAILALDIGDDRFVWLGRRPSHLAADYPSAIGRGLRLWSLRLRRGRPDLGGLGWSGTALVDLRRVGLMGHDRPVVVLRR